MWKTFRSIQEVSGAHFRSGIGYICSRRHLHSWNCGHAVWHGATTSDSCETPPTYVSRCCRTVRRWRALYRQPARLQQEHSHPRYMLVTSPTLISDWLWLCAAGGWVQNGAVEADSGFGNAHPASRALRELVPASGDVWWVSGRDW